MRNDKNKNMLLLIYIIIINFCVVAVVASITFSIFKDGKYTEWITMIVTLMGSVLSGIITMAGVVLTLNRNCDENIEKDSKERKSKEEEIKQKAYIVYEELNSYLESLLDLNKKILKYHIKNYWNDGIMEGHSKILEYNRIYEPIPNIKELFYEVVNFYPYVDRKYIKIFVKFNKEYSRVKQILDKLSTDRVFNRINNLGVESFNNIFLDKRKSIYTSLNYEVYKINEQKGLDIRSKDLEEKAEDDLTLIECSKVYSDEINELLDFLKTI